MKRIGSALVRSISRTSSSSCSSSSDDEAYAAGTTAEITPSTTPATTTASNSPTPSITAPLSPLQRTVSALSRFSLTPPKSDPFEQLEAERQKRESKHRKRTEKKVAAFHSDITGAVFVGTVKFFPEPGVELPSAPIETEKGKGKMSSKSSTGLLWQQSGCESGLSISSRKTHRTPNPNATPISKLSLRTTTTMTGMVWSWNASSMYS